VFWRKKDLFYDLAELAEAAFSEGDLQRAVKLADELLKLAIGRERDWNYGNAIHKGHIVRGQVALARGNVESARIELLLAGGTPGSPQLDTFGPDTTLAEQLLGLGETAVVLAYLDLIRVFWRMHGGRLDAWTEDILEGRPPAFGWAEWFGDERFRRSRGQDH
jgi:hypothetical protein